MGSHWEGAIWVNIWWTWGSKPVDIIRILQEKEIVQRPWCGSMSGVFKGQWGGWIKSSL